MLSPEYKEQLSKLHAENEGFGTTSDAYASIVRKLIAEHKPKTVCDYGCGKQAIKPYVEDLAVYIPYDPAIPGCDCCSISDSYVDM